MLAAFPPNKIKLCFSEISYKNGTKMFECPNSSPIPENFNTFFLKMENSFQNFNFFAASFLKLWVNHFFTLEAHTKFKQKLF